MSKRPLAFAMMLLTAAVIAVVLLPTRLQKELTPSKKEKLPQATLQGTKATAAQKQMALNRLSHLPLSFEENRGQADARVKYLSRGTDYGLFLTPTEATIVHNTRMRVPDSMQGADATGGLASLGASTVKTNSIVRLSWIGADPKTEARGVGLQRGITNYLLGNDRSQWHRRVPRYSGVELRHVYPGIDLVYHGNAQKLEFDYNIAPKADPKQIQVGIDGPSLVAVDGEGRLTIDVGGDHVVLLKPVVYQERNGKRTLVEAKYVMKESHRFGFELGPYDTSLPLVIDPVLEFAANFGGGYTSISSSLALDSLGDMYITGTTCATDYPLTNGVYQSTGGANVSEACNTAIVTELNPSGSSLIFSTYLGGTGVNFGMGLLLDATGNPIVAGTTNATNFPTTTGAYQTAFAKAGTCDYDQFLENQACSDGFLTKLNADGSNLIFSTLLGGERADFILALAAGNGNLYVTGATNSTKFPTAGTPYSTTYGGGTICQGGFAPCFDAFVSEFSANGTQLVASTYLGGNDDDFAAGIVLDGSGNVYVSGTTDSGNFPKTSTIGTNSPHPGQDDIFVTKLNAGLSKLLYSTQIGGSGNDLGIGLRVDSTGAAYVTGTTGSSDFPVTSGAYQTTYGGPSSPSCPDMLDGGLLSQPSCGDAFVIKLNPAGSALTFGTYLGGSGPDIAFNLALDSSLNIWVTGNTGSPNYPYTPDAYYTGETSAFLSELSANGSSLLFSTALSEESAGGGALALVVQIDGSNNVYVSGASTQVQPTPGAYATPSSPGIYLMKFSPGTARPGMQLSTNSISWYPPNYLVPVNSTSPPQTVTLTNNGTAPLNLQLSIGTQYDIGNPSVFPESDNCGSTVAAGAECTISVSYAPNNASLSGGDGATIYLLSNAPGSPQIISLSGTTGIIQSASFVPPTLTFTGQAPSTPTPSQMAYLTGSTPSALSFETRTLALPVIGGPNASDFQVNTTYCPVGQSFCQISVVFDPAALGPATRTATVSVASDAANSPQVLNLSGTVSTPPLIALSQNPVVVNSTPVGVAQNSSSVAITNTGGGTLNVAGMTLSGPNAGDFQLSSGGCNIPAFSLPSQSSCGFYIAFTPSAVGNRVATLTFVDNETNPTKVSITGYGATSGGPMLIIFTTGQSYNGVSLFPDTMVGQTTTYNQVLVTMQNLGTGGAHLTSATLTGDFSILASSSNCPGPTTLLTGGSACTYAVIFSPTALGTRTGALTVTTDAPGNPSFTANFQGNGVAIPVPSLAPSLLEFGAQAVGTSSAVQKLLLTNTGNGPLTFTGLTAPAGFSFAANTCTSPLAAGASCTVSVQFSAPSVGPTSGMVALTTNAAGQTLGAALHGTGVTGMSPQATPASLTFGNQEQKTTSFPQLVTFSNAGTAAFNITGFQVSENFKQSNNCPASLAPGASCAITVLFAPTSDTFPDFPVTGHVYISTNVPGSPFAIPLAGTSQVPLAIPGGDYDGLGKTDIAIWRPSSGVWYILPSNNPNAPIIQQWGQTINGVQDIPVPGDYDGDGKTDIAVWRPSNGVWYIIPSSHPKSLIIQQWGETINGVQDVPVPGDYDGDGITDFAVWRPSTGTWFIIPSSNPSSLIIVQWGETINGVKDVPVPGDYDGDGKTDIAVWRPSTGTWFIIPSSNPSSLIIQQWGETINGVADIPVQGDYDGDGQTDIAVWRPSTGTWYIIPSGNPSSLIIKQWGETINGVPDVPVPGDYDVDGKTDIAVWRPSTGMWYIVPSSNPNGYILKQWGISGDVPVPGGLK
jgi:Beta-propeller repeat/FG-GAP-like repeat